MAVNLIKERVKDCIEGRVLRKLPYAYKIMGAGGLAKMQVLML